MCWNEVNELDIYATDRIENTFNVIFNFIALNHFFDISINNWLDRLLMT